MIRQGKILDGIGIFFTLLLIFIATWNRYYGLMSGLEYSSIDYYKVIITKSMDPFEIVKHIVYPENGLFLQNIFLLFPFKLLTVFFSLHISYALSSLLVIVAASWLLYLILRNFLDKRLSLLLLWLLMFTQTSITFLESLNFRGKNFSQLGNLALLDFPNPSSIILGILIFFYYGILRDAPPKSKTLMICLCLFLQVLISPVSSILCGVWALLHYFMSARSPRFNSTRKVSLSVFSVYWIIVSSQVFILIRGTSGTYESLIGGILINQTFQFSWVYLFLYILFPLAGLLVSRATMNVSWHEIVHRFSFILLLYVTSIVTLIFSIIKRDGALQAVLSSSGITPLTNTLVLVPLLCLFSEARFSNFLVVRNHFFGSATRILPVLMNLVIIVLLFAVTIQSTWITVSVANSRSLSICPTFNDEDRIEIEQMVLRSTDLDLEGKKVLILDYANRNMDPSDFAIFMENPIGHSNTGRSTGDACVQKGLGYLSLNGLNQSRLSRISATDLVVIFTQNRTSN